MTELSSNPYRDAVKTCFCFSLFSALSAESSSDCTCRCWPLCSLSFLTQRNKKEEWQEMFLLERKKVFDELHVNQTNLVCSINPLRTNHRGTHCSSSLPPMQFFILFTKNYSKLWYTWYQHSFLLKWTHWKVSEQESLIYPVFSMGASQSKKLTSWPKVIIYFPERLRLLP